MFSTAAYAQDALGAASEPSILTNILPIVLIFVIFWFLMIRPQQKKMKEHQALINAVQRGDVVVTGGGIIGKVTKVADEEVTVEIADGVKIKVVKPTITNVRSKTEPANEND